MTPTNYLMDKKELKEQLMKKKKRHLLKEIQYKIHSVHQKLI